MSTSHHLQQESRLRSLVKGFTWRILATLTTFVIAWEITNELGKATIIAAIEFFAKILIYYLHERAWLMIPLGRARIVSETPGGDG